ncbi:bile acid:sodium symporter family protein [Methanolobus bombayensis]|uniref:bile acid:sodium symporter family protein n=1 Tax=Methanolobus bombayensis TaxID=38023 RepID=UPI001AE37CDE|nr:bile acid:sodium symporter family protein [Methanolobus bombayensis]MBP1908631.1 BASS family bile acid:Na+ symporter [Methanolobus bombayensis]
MIKKFTSLFPVWAILLSVMAFIYPSVFSPYKSAITPLLGVVMFGMGITLSANDFLLVLKRPKVIVLGTALQYILMPLIAFILSYVLNLPLGIMAGMVLLGACPGGTASNVICYLAKGDVALSITLTSVSTLLAFILTPALTWLYIGQAVPVEVGSMMLSIVKIVLVPVALGIFLNTFFDKHIERFRHAFPALSVATIVFIIAIIIALNKDSILVAGKLVIVAVILHNGFGLVSGYLLSKKLGFDEKDARTIAIEVGMQNSGLSVALAVKYFSSFAALPGALFSIWHNIMGSALAAYWSSDNDKTSL